MLYLLDVVRNFKKGTIGPGHYGFNEAKQQQGFKSAKNSFSDRNGKKKESEESIGKIAPMSKKVQKLIQKNTD